MAEADRLYRVLLVAYAASPMQGSEPGKAWYWAEALAQRGHTVELLVADSGTNLALIAARRAELGSAGERIRVHVVSRPFLPRWVRLPGGLRSSVDEVVQYLGWQKRALQFARERGLHTVDVVHHISYGSLQAGCALARLGPPLVFGPVGGGQTAPLSARRFLGRGWWFEYLRSLVWATIFGMRRSARHDLARSALVLSSNAETDGAARRMGASIVRRAACSGIRSDLVLAPDTARAEDHAPTLLWIGKFEPRKAPSLAVAAMPALLAHCPGARLLMIGDGPLTADLHRLAGELGVAGSIDFLGRVQWADYLTMLDDSDLLLFTAMRDSFGTQNVEAWARGAPTVGIDHQGVAANAGSDNAELVALEPIDSLADRLGAAAGRLLNDRARLADRSVRVRGLAADLTYEAKALASENWYEFVLDGAESSAARPT